MGQSKLVYSPIKLCLTNQSKICLIGHLEGVEVSIDGWKHLYIFNS